MFWKRVRRIVDGLRFKAVLGFGALLLLNATASFTGLSLGLNFFNAAVVAILGVSGLGLLLLVQWVLG